jgi:hypothetical protein
LAVSARGTTQKTTIRAIASSVVYGGAALGIRSMKGLTRFDSGSETREPTA